MLLSQSYNSLKMKYIFLALTLQLLVVRVYMSTPRYKGGLQLIILYIREDPMIGDRNTEIKGEEGLVEGQLSQANHLRRPKGESTCEANLRRASDACM